ncbi:MAG: hypothetical protein LBF08_07585 [Dysgonamonadaceae bacterium]|nr:hypothetical protein [Dysgonamonadaceae bacterium]
MKKILLFASMLLLPAAVVVMAQDNAVIGYPLVINAGDYYAPGNIQITSTGSLEVYGFGREVGRKTQCK